MYYNVKISLNIIRYFADLLGDCLIDTYPANLGTMILFNY